MRVKEKEKEAKVLLRKKAKSGHLHSSKPTGTLFDAVCSLSESQSTINYQIPLRKAKKDVKGNFA